MKLKKKGFDLNIINSKIILFFIKDGFVENDC